MQNHYQQAITDDYRACIAMARGHYENFPVVSFWLPRRIRPAVAAIYAFARTADDFADEGNDTAAERLQKLSTYRQYLSRLEHGEEINAPIFLSLGDAIRQHHLPIQPFYDLLSAFSQDVSTTRYQTFSEVQDYCRRSANPIGLLMLSLYGAATEKNIVYSNHICSALQWINFFQDIEQDYQEMQRIYIPTEDLHRYGVTEKHFQQKIADDNMSSLMLAQINRVRQILLSGLPLEKSLRGRIRWIIATTVRCGIKVLDHLEKAARQQHTFSRPRLSKTEVLFSGLLLPYTRLDRMRIDINEKTSNNIVP